LYAHFEVRFTISRSEVRGQNAEVRAAFWAFFAQNGICQNCDFNVICVIAMIEKNPVNPEILSKKQKPRQSLNPTHHGSDKPPF
jgi:hypothetical protein